MRINTTHFGIDDVGAELGLQHLPFDVMCAATKVLEKRDGESVSDTQRSM
ncbi:hypothetical protein [Piscinibacter gummiphilus]|nr:hypothetical protein [Piscinibacter gummiphilus]GLS94420.1 hypothetical protein GCM10007918_17120 [Piscinibacter gummiphilus]